MTIFTYNLLTVKSVSNNNEYLESTNINYTYLVFIVKIKKLEQLSYMQAIRKFVIKLLFL